MYFVIKFLESNSHKILIGLMLLSAFYLLPGVLSPREFWVEDETRYAEIIRELLSEKKWLVLHLNGYFYPDKPPLFFWLIAISALLTGTINIFSFMIITWLSTLGVIWATFKIARQFFNQFESILGVMVLMSMFLFLVGAGIVRMDMLMTFFVILACYFFWEGYHSGKSLNYFLMWIFMGLAVMTKGPLGLLFPLLPSVVFLIICKKWKDLIVLILNPGIIVCLFMIGGWLGAAWATGNQDFVINIFEEQLIGRSVNSFHHKKPFHFYLILLIPMLLPWGIYLPRTIYQLWKQFRINKGMLFLFLWFVIGLLTISLISGKIFIYMLPLLPPTAIMIGKHMADVLKKNNISIAFKIEAILVIIFFFGMLSIAPLGAKHFMNTKGIPVNTIAIMSVVFLSFALFFIFKKKVISFFILLFVSMFFYNGYMFLKLAPSFDHLFSSKQAGIQIQEAVQKGHMIAIAHISRGIFSFYANQKIKEIDWEELPSYLQESPENIVLLKQRHLKNVYKELDNERIIIIADFNISNTEYVMIKYRI